MKMADDNRGCPKATDGSSDNLAADYHRITLAVEGLCENYEAARSDRTKHDGKTLFWGRIAGIGIGIYTLLTVGIVCASIYLAQQARLGTEAARHSVAIAEDTERRLLRAYVLVEDSKLNKFGGTEAPEADVIIKNFGRTPASAMTVWVGVKGADDFTMVSFPRRPTDLPIARMAFGPGGEMHWPAPFSRALNQAEIDSIKQAKGALFVYGEIRYRDAFDCSHFTKFRLIYGGNAGARPEGDLAIANDGNETDRNCE
jgi:hypothetical protein